MCGVTSLGMDHMEILGWFLLLYCNCYYFFLVIDIRLKNASTETEV